ncbi:hypothetical protein MAP00_000926 [Monascus purpureus]|nr:hypothetical protein MAP00_000926 [Monascus purpureus]
MSKSVPLQRAVESDPREYPGRQEGDQDRFTCRFNFFSDFSGDFGASKLRVPSLSSGPYKPHVEKGVARMVARQYNIQELGSALVAGHLIEFSSYGVTGVQGLPPPPTAKVGITAAGGFAAEYHIYICGLDIEEKVEWIKAQTIAALGPESYKKLSLLQVTIIGVPKDDPKYQDSSTVDVRLKELLGNDYVGKPIDQFEIPGLKAVHFLLQDHLDRGYNAGAGLDCLRKSLVEYIRTKYIDVPVKFLEREDHDCFARG